MTMDGQSPVLVSWGEFLWDLFPSGAQLGGAPCNVALHWARAELPTALITRVGCDTSGRDAIAALTELGLHPAGLQIDDSLPTGKVGIEVNNGEAKYRLYPGAWQEIQCDTAALELLARARVFSYGTLSQESGPGLESFRAALAAIPSSAVRVCDPNLRGGRIDPELVRDHLSAATIIKINDEEARVLENCYGCPDITRWLLKDLNVELVARTHGSSGATLTRGDEVVHHPGFPAGQGGDNVGAGDAFTSVLIRAYLKGTTLQKSVEAANLYASFVAGNTGATPTPPPDLQQKISALLAA